MPPAMYCEPAGLLATLSSMVSSPVPWAVKGALRRPPAALDRPRFGPGALRPPMLGLLAQSVPDDRSPATDSPARAPARSRLEKEVEQLAEEVIALEWVAHRHLGMDLVGVLPAHPVLGEVASDLQLVDDAMGGTLGDPHVVGDVAHPPVRLSGHRQQHVGVIGQ